MAANSDQVTIRGNLIAHNASGGVMLDGTNLSVLYNTLSANYWGLAVGGGLTHAIIGNAIGTGPDGLTVMPNLHEGILLAGGAGIAAS